MIKLCNLSTIPISTIINLPKKNFFESSRVNFGEVYVNFCHFYGSLTKKTHLDSLSKLNFSNKHLKTGKNGENNVKKDHNSSFLYISYRNSFGNEPLKESKKTPFFSRLSSQM